MTYLLTTSIYYVMNMSLNSKSDTTTHSFDGRLRRCRMPCDAWGRSNRETKVNERKKLCGFLGLAKENGQYRRRHCHELKTNVGKITDVLRKMKIVFYWSRGMNEIDKQDPYLLSRAENQGVPVH